MKIALIGYGKMGKMMEKAFLAKGHEIVVKIDPKEKVKDITAESVASADMCMEFTHPEQVLKNIHKLASLKKNVIVGTTGWHSKLPEVETLVQKEGIGLFYASNFAIGIHLFFQMLEKATSLMNGFADFDVAGLEAHHNEKVDSPSGAGREMGELVLKNIKRKKKMVADVKDRAILKEEFQLSSLRCGHMPGTHTLLFDSPAETISLSHTSRSRESFASGAVLAAEWMQGKKGCYTMKDLLKS